MFHFFTSLNFANPEYDDFDEINVDEMTETVNRGTCNKLNYYDEGTYFRKTLNGN